MGRYPEAEVSMNDLIQRHLRLLKVALLAGDKINIFAEGFDSKNLTCHMF